MEVRNFFQVYDGKTNAIQANVSSKFPLFIVSGLDPGKELKMLIYAANSKGRSEPVLLEGFTLKVAEKQTGEIYWFTFFSVWALKYTLICEAMRAPSFLTL